MTQGNRPTAQAFMRRGPNPNTQQPRDVAGLSVTLAGRRTEPQVLAEEIAKWNPRGICKILIADVYATSETLDVVPDKPTHANITGLPEVPEDPPTTEAGKIGYRNAEFWGGELAMRAQMCSASPKEAPR